MKPVFQYLSRFIDLSEEEFSLLVGFIEIRHFNKKVKLVDIGEQEGYINFVMKGLIRKYFYRHAEEVVTQLAKEGELICSSVSFLTGERSDYIVESIETATVLSISAANVEKIYALGPRMERMGRLIIIEWLLQKEYWENARIKQDSKTRFLHFIQANPDLPIRVPQKILASYLNIKPETFSRYKHLLTRPYQHSQVLAGS